MICSEENTTSPFPRTVDDEETTIQRPGGKMVRNYRKMVSALSKGVHSFDLGRHIYG